MSALSQTERDALMERHPDVFSKSRGSLISKAAIAVSVAVYFVFAWWFFSIGTVFSEGRWDIAGSYLADWVSYESRPDIEFGEKHLEVGFPRFDPAGNNPDPEWLFKETAVVERTITTVTQTVSGGGKRSSSNSLLGTIGGEAAPSGSSGGSVTTEADKKVETLRQEEVVRAVVDMSGAGTIDFDTATFSQNYTVGENTIDIAQFCCAFIPLSSERRVFLDPQAFGMNSRDQSVGARVSRLCFLLSELERSEITALVESKKRVIVSRCRFDHARHGRAFFKLLHGFAMGRHAGPR